MLPQRNVEESKMYMNSVDMDTVSANIKILQL